MRVGRQPKVDDFLFPDATGKVVHADDPADHGEDQYEWSGRGPAAAAQLLLEAVADRDERSVELASTLARAVLDRDAVYNARQLDALIRNRSPFALVRAVKPAETLLLAEPTGADVARARASGRRS